MSSVTVETDAVDTGRPRRRPGRRGTRLALFAIGAGLLLATAGIGYLVYAEVARARLDDLVYEVPVYERAAWLTAASPAKGASGPTAGRQPDAAAPVAPGFIAELFPARWTNPRYWAEPEWAGAAPYGRADIPEGFEYVNPADLNAGTGKPAAETLAIRAIGLSTTVYELGTRFEGDRLVWDSPVDIVGHIPGTSQPGETGAGWYFGHLESPVRGEGNVFHRLPEVVDLIKNDPVDIIIGSDDGEFLYRVTETGFMHRDDLELTGSPHSTVTLVASYPRLVYDHRLLVTGELLAYRPPG